MGNKESITMLLSNFVHQFSYMRNISIVEIKIEKCFYHGNKLSKILLMQK